MNREAAHTRKTTLKADSTEITHMVTNYKSGITPFSGNANGVLLQGVNIFIDSIDNHLASKSIIEQEEQLTEAKNYLFIAKEDLGYYSRSIVLFSNIGPGRA